MSARLTRPLAGLLVVLAMLLPASAGAAEPEEDAGSERRAAASRANAQRNYHRYLEMLATGEGDPARSARAVMIGAGMEAAGLEGGVSLGGGDCFEYYRELESVGDLTGDGLQDVLEYSYFLDYCEWTIDVSVAALRGTDAEYLWGTSFPEVGFLLPVGDLDGQTGDDLLAYDVVSSDMPGAYRWTITVRGIAGDDGATLWTRRYEDPWTGVYSGPTAGFVEVDYAIPAGVGDANGDGRDDLLLARYQSAFVDDASSGQFAGGSLALFEVISGANGAPIVSHQGTGNQAFPEAAFMPDANDDGLVDVAVMSAEREEDGVSVDVVAYPGKGGPPIDLSSAHTFASPILGTAELTGDGRGDVFLNSIDWADSLWESLTWVTVLPTADTWQMSMGTQGLGFATPVPDVDGDGGQDLVLLTEQRRSTIAQLLLPAAEDGDTFGWGRAADWIEFAGDLTGDGAEDLLLYDWERMRGVRVDTTTAVSGRDGSTAWSFTNRSDEAWQYLFPVHADTNANGTSDLALVGEPSSGDVYEIVDGAQRTSLWPKPRPVQGYLLGLEGVQLVGPGQDLLETAYLGGGGGFIATRARRGSNGALLWSR